MSTADDRLRWSKTLKLSDDQQAKINVILADQLVQILTIKQDNSFSPEDKNL